MEGVINIYKESPVLDGSLHLMSRHKPYSFLTLDTRIRKVQETYGY